ncbi:MAG: vitamin B12 dependent-methionine synthase activation domain-containing protein [Candidatus Geothermincolia bacterium]
MKIVRPAIDTIEIERLRAQTLDVLTGGTGRANPETLRALDEGVPRAVASADPHGGYVRSLIESVNDGTITTRDGNIKSAKFSNVARAASGDRCFVVFTIATVGGTFDEELDAEKSLLDRFVIDTIGSEFAEIVADLVEEEWKNEMALAGLDATVRISPGYCDWSLEGQDLIFTALDASELGVRLTPSYLMIPAKSVSSAAVAAARVPLKVPCAACGKTDCAWRRAHRGVCGAPPEEAMGEGL